MIALLLAAWADPGQTLLQEWRRSDALLEARPVTPTWIRALGRLRDARAADHLVPQLETEHARDAAFALTLTPGTAPILRRLAAQEGEGTEGDTRWLGIEGLGRQGTAADVPTLIRTLDAGWPYDDAAARALLRLHRRGVDITPSHPALDRPYVDPRTEIAVAQTIARTFPAGSLKTDWRLARTSAARAALLKASGRDLDWGLWDLPAVQVQALQLATDAQRDEVIARLDHEDGWIRYAAIEAAGRLGATEALEARLEAAAGAEAASIHRALSRGVPPGADVDPRVAAVWVGQQEDRDELVDLARAGSSPHVRSAAASRALERDPSTAIPLLESPDAAVREAAVDALEPSAGAVEELVFALRVERDPGVLGVGLATLLDWKRGGQRVERSRYLESTLKRAMAGPDTRPRVLATTLAEALGVPMVAPPAPTQVRELILPDGTVTTTVGDLPVPAEIVRYQGAHLYTSRGRITITLAPDVAPLNVHDFVTLARSGFYTELPWHRVVPGFVVQGGCPRGDGWGGPGWLVVDEVSERRFVDGAVGMARADRDTAGSQFFVSTGPARFLEGDYTWFGSVTEGLAIARALTPDDVLHRVEILVAP